VQIAKWRWDRLALVALLGAAGGAINALLCLARMPVPVAGDPDFHRVVVPGGALHGAVLAICPLLVALAMGNRRLSSRALAALVVGWMAGFVSWIPLHHWALGSNWSESVRWPFVNATWASVTLMPFECFGLVSLIFFVGVAWARTPSRLGWHVAIAVCAGALGSLWWWGVEFGPWYFALIHGTIWGTLVGIGTYRAFAPASQTSSTA
jgi:hypothetical protein